MRPVIGEVPETWIVGTLADHCQLQVGPSGTTLRSQDYVGGGIPVVAAGDIRDLRIVGVPATSVTPETAERLRKFRLIAGDILLVRVGSTTRHALVAADQEGWLFSNTCSRIRPQPDVDPGYLSCYLSHPAVKEWREQSTRQGVMPSLTVAAMAQLPVVLPPLPTQRAIAEVMQSINAKIEVHRRIACMTEELGQLLLAQMMSGQVGLLGQ